MKKLVFILFIGMFLILGATSSYALPTSFGEATHNTPAWQDIADISWNINGGAWGNEEDLHVGQTIQFKFDVHKSNVGTHYADFLKAWVHFGDTGPFDETSDVIAFGMHELQDYESGNFGSWEDPLVPEFSFVSDAFVLSMAGSLNLRARVTCSESLGYNKFWRDSPTPDTGYFDDAPLASTFNERFKSIGYLNQGEVEELTLTVSVPEPATIFLFGAGFLGIVVTRRKIKK